MQELEAESESLREMLSSLQDMEEQQNEQQKLQKDINQPSMDVQSTHPLIPILKELTGRTIHNGITDLQATIEYLSSPELMGGLQVTVSMKCNSFRQFVLRFPPYCIISVVY